MLLVDLSPGGPSLAEAAVEDALYRGNRTNATILEMVQTSRADVFGGIGQLVGPLGEAEFARLWSKQEPFSFRCGPALFERLTSEFSDLGQVRGVPDRQFRIGDAEAASGLRFADGEAAADAYSANRTVVAQRVDHTTGWLSDWIESFLHDTALPVAQAKANVFFSPPKSGLARHFDNHEVLIVGLKGEKRFRVAPNAVVQYPDRNDDQYEDQEGQLAAERLAPALPNERVVQLGPGDVIHIPRGWWHATEAQQATASITFGFWSATIGDLLSDVSPDSSVGRSPITVDDEHGSQERAVQEAIRSTDFAVPDLAFRMAQLDLASQSKYRSGLQ